MPLEVLCCTCKLQTECASVSCVQPAHAQADLSFACRLAMMRRNQNGAANQVGMSQRTGNGSVGGNSHYVI